MISATKKFIFIHPPKTAGNSIQNILRKYSEDKILSQRKDPHNKNILDGFRLKNNHLKTEKHSSLNDYYHNWNAEMFGNIENYFKFGTTRNPWDRAVSLYFHGLKLGTQPPFTKKNFLNHLRTTNFWKRPLCSFLSVKNHGLEKIDFLIKYESLQEDFDVACDKIGIPREKLPVTNKSKHEHYTEHYDDETRDVAAKKFAKDIEYFGYEFGG
jgi:hypothetical protein